MPRPIEILEGMQNIDLVLKTMEDEERRYEKKLSDLGRELERIRQDIEVLESESEGLREAVKEADLRINQANDRISKNEEKIRAVSGSRELKALNKEVSIAGKIIRQAEKDASDLRGRLTEKGLVKEARELELEKISAEIEALKSELAAKRAEWGSEAESRRTERQALAAQLPEDTNRVYENIRAKRGGRAVVPLRGEACQGCYMHVPPQTYVRLKRGEEEIIRCPHCERILYVEAASASEASGAS